MVVGFNRWKGESLSAGRRGEIFKPAYWQSEHLMELFKEKSTLKLNI